MRIFYKTGSVIEASEPYIAHGCNAQGVMGAGVARLIKERYPAAFTGYRNEYQRLGDTLPLGHLIPVKCGDKTILNLVTQDRYSRDRTVLHADYSAIERAMAAVNVYVPPGAAVAMPLIGAGLANGRWSMIGQIIETQARRFTPVVYLVDGVVPRD